LNGDAQTTAADAAQLFHRTPRAGRQACLALACTLLLLVGFQAESLAAEPPEPEAPSFAAGALERLEVFPASIELDGPRAQQQLVVTAHLAGDRLRDVTHAAEYRWSEGEAVANVENGAVLPVQDGSAKLLVSFEGKQVDVPATAGGQDGAAPVPFKHGVLAALTKQGCNGGACHGSPSGKGGFRLSLHGYKPSLDRHSLLRDAHGRRTNRFDPAASLILLKPTMRLPHGGGLRLREGELAYRILSDWVGGGCPADAKDAPHCERIHVYPKQRILHEPGWRQQLAVTAEFSDGSRRDVTPLAVFSSTDEAVAKVDRAGSVRAEQRGETTVVVRYLEQIAVSRLTFLPAGDGFAWTEPPAEHKIDRHVNAKLKLLRIPPSPLCSDSEFIRRLYLDALGILPERKEVEAFLADRSPQKRERLIDRVLARPEHAEFWAQKWGDLLRVKSARMTEAGVFKLHRWLVGAMQDDMPLDGFARKLLTATGSTYRNPPAGFLRAADSTDDCAESVAQLFLGIRIQCAKCHNHPFERWTQNNYYGLGAFFARLGKKPTPLAGEVVLYDAGSGEVKHPETGRAVRPWFPMAGILEPAEKENRRELLADLLTRGGQRSLFARVAANRIWAHLMGRGIVDPVDDFRVSNPPSNEALLDALAAELVRGGYRQRELIRSILRSRAYQRSSRATPENADDRSYFSHARARLLSAEQLLDAICHFTGVAEKFPGLPLGVRATALPSPDSGTEFLRTFGQPSRESVCQCGRDSQPKLAHALELINGPLVAGKLRSHRGRLAMLLREHGGRSVGEPPKEKLALWLAADRDVAGENGAPVEDGQSAARWLDQTEHGLHVTQTAGERQPRFVARGVGGSPALHFDGDDLLHCVTGNVLESGDARTVFLVAQVDRDADGGSLLTFRRATRGASGRTTVFTCQHGLSGGAYYVYSDGVNSSGNSTLGPETIDLVRRPFVTGFVSGGAGDKLAVTINGKPQTVGQRGGIGTDDGATGFTVGNREDVPGFGFTGLIAEILVYEGALDAQARRAVGSYLTAKYSLATEYPLPQRPQSAEDAKKQAAADRAILTDLYYAAYGRPPRESELTTYEHYLQQSEDRRRALEDICWAILNSKEFLFQH